MKLQDIHQSALNIQENSENEVFKMLHELFLQSWNNITKLSITIERNTIGMKCFISVWRPKSVEKKGIVLGINPMKNYRLFGHPLD